MISQDEIDELFSELEPIVLKFAENHFHGESVKIVYTFGEVTITV